MSIDISETPRWSTYFLKNLLFSSLNNRTRSSFQKLKIPRRKANTGLKSLSYTGPSLWNNLNENLKRSSSINDFKHKIKEFYFKELKKTKHDS